jgi:hypothetical protein|tara:strand:- start:3799 stop:4266 length:468 start_codon:yes stop_codon:yes gene_type:complete
MKKVIFDLDGTLALIDKRRAISTKDNGKMNWDTFFDPKNIDLDLPHQAVIDMAKVLKDAGHMIVIFSGRSKATKDATNTWLKKFDVPCDVLKMRPTGNDFKFMPDDDLKKKWFNDLFPTQDHINDVVCVFDDRQKVVDMWRDMGLTCMQVAPGNF